MNDEVGSRESDYFLVIGFVTLTEPAQSPLAVQNGAVVATDAEIPAGDYVASRTEDGTGAWVSREGESEAGAVHYFLPSEELDYQSDIFEG